MHSLGTEMEELPPKNNAAQHQKFIYGRTHGPQARNQVKKHTASQAGALQLAGPPSKTGCEVGGPSGLSVQSKLAFLHQRVPMSLLCQLGPSEISLVYEQLNSG